MLPHTGCRVTQYLNISPPVLAGIYLIGGHVFIRVVDGLKGQVRVLRLVCGARPTRTRPRNEKVSLVSSKSLDLYFPYCRSQTTKSEIKKTH
jgi:hypothetical protein